MAVSLSTRGAHGERGDPSRYGERSLNPGPDCAVVTVVRQAAVQHVPQVQLAGGRFHEMDRNSLLPGMEIAATILEASQILDAIAGVRPCDVVRLRAPPPRLAEQVAERDVLVPVDAPPVRVDPHLHTCRERRTNASESSDLPTYLAKSAESTCSGPLRKGTGGCAPVRRHP